MALFQKRVKADQEGSSAAVGWNQEPWLTNLDFQPITWMFSLLERHRLRHRRKAMPGLAGRRSFNDRLRLALLCEGERAKVGRAAALPAPVVNKAAAQSDYLYIPEMQPLLNRGLSGCSFQSRRNSSTRGMGV